MKLGTGIILVAVRFLGLGKASICLHISICVLGLAEESGLPLSTETEVTGYGEDCDC